MPADEFEDFDEDEDNTDEQYLGYGATSNISFHGRVETGYTKQEWSELSDKTKAEITEQALWDLVDIWEVD